MRFCSRKRRMPLSYSSTTGQQALQAPKKSISIAESRSTSLTQTSRPAYYASLWKTSGPLRHSWILSIGPWDKSLRKSSSSTLTNSLISSCQRAWKWPSNTSREGCQLKLSKTVSQRSQLKKRKRRLKRKSKWNRKQKIKARELRWHRSTSLQQKHQSTIRHITP